MTCISSGEADAALPPSLVSSLFSGCITMKFYTGVSYSHSVASDIKKDFQKSDDIIGNDIIMLKPLSLCRKIKYLKNMRNICIISYQWSYHNENLPKGSS